MNMLDIDTDLLRTCVGTAKKANVHPLLQPAEMAYILVRDSPLLRLLLLPDSPRMVCLQQHLLQQCTARSQ